jgi:hypothetical protein
VTLNPLVGAVFCGVYALRPMATMSEVR